MNKIFCFIFIGLFFGLLSVFENVDAYGYSFIGITSEGVEIPIVLKNDQTENNGDGESVLDGFGYTASIVTIEDDGKITWGNGISGIEKSITPYSPTKANADFASVILDSDLKNTYSIPSFWKTHTLNNNSLVDNTLVNPNILGFSNSQSKYGSNSISIDSQGIHVSGTGMRVIKVNQMNGIDLIYRTTLSSGASVDLVSSPNDLSSISHDGSKFILYNGNVQGELTSSKVLHHYGYFCRNQGSLQSDTWPIPLLHYQDYSCGAKYWSYAYSANPVSVSLTDVFVKNPDSAVSSSYGSSSFTFGWYKYTSSPSGAFNRSVGVNVSGEPTVATSPYGTYTKINSISKSSYAPMPSGKTISVPVSANFQVKEAQPYDLHLSTTTNTELSYTMPSGDLYLIVKPNGGTVTIKGENSISRPYVDISNLPRNTAYQISKDGWIGVTGVTTSEGTITLQESDVKFEGFNQPGGLLHLYPDSLAYRGTYDTLTFDSVNEEIFHTNPNMNQIYVAAAYVKLPIPIDVTFDEIKIGDISLDYLAGDYVMGDEIYVPILPDMQTLSLTLNGQNAVINISDITNTAQSKILSSATNSDSIYSNDHSISSIEIDATTSAVAIATHSGLMNIHIEESVSGEAEFTINSDYTESYSQPYTKCQAAMAAYGGNNGCVQHGHPVDTAIQKQLVQSQALYDATLSAHVDALSKAVDAQGPLTVTVTVFNNGEYVDKFTIHRDSAPILSASSELGLVSVQNAKLVYSESSGSRTISIPVQSGDYVEFVVAASIVASGIPSPVDLDNSEIAGFARGTVNIHHGTITVTMG